MSVRASVAQATAVASTMVGPTLAAAESSGVLDDVGHKLVVYFASAVLTLIGALVSGLFYFVKKEYSSITGGLTGVRVDLEGIADALTELRTVVVELRGEVARRVSVDDHSRSAGRLHEKINRIDRSLAVVRVKVGLGEDGEDGEDGGDDES